MRASARFDDWRECGLELVLEVRLQIGALFFHVEDPHMGLFLEMAFLTLDLAFGKIFLRALHSKFSCDISSQDETIFTRAHFHRILKKNVTKIAQISFPRTSGAHKEMQHIVLVQSPPGWTIALFDLLAEFSPQKWEVYLDLEYIKPHILAR